jgi:hypothetical protein
MKFAIAIIVTNDCSIKFVADNTSSFRILCPLQAHTRLLTEFRWYGDTIANSRAGLVGLCRRVVGRILYAVCWLIVPQYIVLLETFSEKMLD